MKNLLLLLAHLLITLARIIKSGGARAVVAENLLLKQQLLVLNRSPAPSAQSPRSGARSVRVLGTVSEPAPDPPSRGGPPALLAAPISCRAQTTQIPLTIQSSQRRCTRTQRAGSGTDPGHCRAQAAQPSLWLPEDCATARQNLRRRNRQGCGTTGPGRPLPSRTSPRWPFVAHVPGPHEGQSLEPGLVPDGVDSREDSLGTGRHGPIQPADHWLWRASRRCRRLGSVPHVQPSHL